MGKHENPYRPETVRYKILAGDGTWDDMSVIEIAEKLNCSRSAVYYALDDIKFRLNYTVKIRNDRKNSRNTVGGNIYRPGSKLWRLYQGDWSKKTITEIASELNTKRETIWRSIWQIGKETGKYIDFLDSRKISCKRRKSINSD